MGFSVGWGGVQYLGCLVGPTQQWDLLISYILCNVVPIMFDLDHFPLCVGEPHRGIWVNILFENGQYPHNSSYEAPCLP